MKFHRKRERKITKTPFMEKKNFIYCCFPLHLLVYTENIFLIMHIHTHKCIHKHVRIYIQPEYCTIWIVWTTVGLKVFLNVRY